MNQAGEGGGGAAGSGQPAAGAPAKTFTQDEVNRIAATARDEGRRSRGDGGGQQSGAPAGDQPPAWAQALLDKGGRAPEAGAPAGRAPTFAEMLNAGSANARPTPTASQGSMPRRVEDVRDDAGLVDVFALSPEQVLAMGPARIREEFEKVNARAKALSGAPPLPPAMRPKR